MSSLSQTKILKYCNMARKISLNSHCFRAQVGAVIVNKEGVVLSTGYNNPPIGINNSQEMGFCNKEKLGFKSGEGYDACRSIHAEQNAILQIGILQTIGAFLFVYGHQFICTQCQKYITAAQISQVFLQPSVNQDYIIINPSNWASFLSMPGKTV